LNLTITVIFYSSIHSTYSHSTSHYEASFFSLSLIYFDS